MAGALVAIVSQELEAQLPQLLVRHPRWRAPSVLWPSQPLWGCSSSTSPVAAVPPRATGGWPTGLSPPPRLLANSVGWENPSSAMSASQSRSPALRLARFLCGECKLRSCGLPPLSATGDVWEECNTRPCGMVTPFVESSDGADKPSGGRVTSPPHGCGACTSVLSTVTSSLGATGSVAAAPWGTATDPVRQPSSASPGPTRAAIALFLAPSATTLLLFFPIRAGSSSRAAASASVGP